MDGWYEVNASELTTFAPHTYGEDANAFAAARYAGGTPSAAASIAVSTGAPASRALHAVSARRPRRPERSTAPRSDDDRCRAALFDGNEPDATPLAQSNASVRGSGKPTPLTTSPAPASPFDAAKS